MKPSTIIALHAARARFDCVVDGGHFTDSIGVFDREQDAFDAGNDWLLDQDYEGTDWVDEPSDPLGGYWNDDDAPSFDVVTINGAGS